MYAVGTWERFLQAILLPLKCEVDMPHDPVPFYHHGSESLSHQKHTDFTNLSHAVAAKPL